MIVLFSDDLLETALIALTQCSRCVEMSVRKSPY